MADISIHNIVKIEIEKYQLDHGTWVCKIDIISKPKLTQIESRESITLFSDNIKVYKKLN